MDFFKKDFTPRPNPRMDWAENHGYSIIEVLIALAVFAIGILGVATLQISSVNGNATARDHMEAGENAQSRIENLMMTPFTELTNDQSVTANGNTMTWTTINKDLDGDGYNETKVIQVKVISPYGRVLSDLRFTRFANL